MCFGVGDLATSKIKVLMESYSYLFQGEAEEGGTGGGGGISCMTTSLTHYRAQQSCVDTSMSIAGRSATDYPSCGQGIVSSYGYIVLQTLSGVQLRCSVEGW